MKKNRWFASVLLTIMLAVSGAAYAHDGDGGNGKDGHHHNACGKFELPEAKRHLLHETMMKTFEKDKPLIEKMHALHKQRHDILAASSFDGKAYESVSARLRETRDRIQKDRTDAFASIAAQFTPEEREMIARRQKHHHHHHHGERDGRDQHAAWHDGHGGADGSGGQGWGNHGGASDSGAPTGNDNAYPPYQTR